jgi:hypothetical protein
MTIPIQNWALFGRDLGVVLSRSIAIKEWERWAKKVPIKEAFTVLKRMALRGTIIWDGERDDVRSGDITARLT